MGAGVLWSVSGKTSEKSPEKPAQHTDGLKNQVVMAESQLPLEAVPQIQQASRPAPMTPPPATIRARGLAAAAKLPLAFEPNQGQTDARAAYLAHGSGYRLFLTPSDAILSLTRGSGAAAETAAVHMQLEGAAADPKLDASQPLPGKTNYFRGNDPSRWVRNVPTFARVQYSAVYPGVDLVFYGQQGQLEYDFDVRSGADPKQIRMNLSGVDGLVLAPDGSLILKTAAREVRWNKPVIYQEIDGRRHPVAGGFQLLADNRVGFTLGQYDRSRDLVIDPTLAYATYFGGTGDEMNPRVAVDATSNIYLAGTTTSASAFPVCVTTATIICPTTPPVPTLEGSSDAFVSKLDPLGTTVLYTTYMNGLSLTPPAAITPYGNATGADSAAGLAVDNQGNAYITGTTNSSDFPVTTNAFQAAPTNTNNHVFVSKLDPTGANLLYSTYLAGSVTENALAIAADNSGNAYILGWTQSVTAGDFPTGNSFQQSANGATKLYFVSKFDSTATTGAASLKFFSYLGGTLKNTPIVLDGVVCAQLPCGGIAIDTTGDAFIGIGTTFTDMAVVNAYQATNHGKSDGYVAKIAPDGSALLYASYLGGSGDDAVNAIALDSGFNAYLTGSTTSTDFPGGSTFIFKALSGPQDAFLAKFNNATTGPIALTFSTYIGGTGTETGNGLVADVAGNAYVVGSTNSSDFPNPAPLPAPPTLATKGPSDAFLVKFGTSTAAITSFISADLLGGTGADRATGIAQSPNAAIVVTGETRSTDFPVTAFNGQMPIQSALSGPSDAFLANYGPSTDLSISTTVSVAPNPVAIGSLATFTYAVKNNGPDTSVGAVLQIPLPGADVVGGTVGAFSSTACVPIGTVPNQVEDCTLGTINSGSSTSITVPVTPAVGTTSLRPPASITLTGHIFPGNTAKDLNALNDQGSAKATVAFFTTAVSPSSQSVVAGKQTARYTITVSPNTPAGFPSSITLSCMQPTTPVALANATCTFTPASFPNIPANSGATTSVLTITTVAPSQTGAVRSGPTFWYAFWLPVFGVAVVGVGSSRRRRWMSAVGLVLLLGTMVWLPACGSKSSGTTTTGTQPGTYSIGIKAVSGSYTYPPTTSPLNVSLIVTAN